MANRAFVCGIAMLGASSFYVFYWIAKCRRTISICVRTSLEFEFEFAYLQHVSALNSRYFPFEILIRCFSLLAGEVVRSTVHILKLRIVVYLLNERPFSIFAFIVSIEFPRLRVTAIPIGVVVTSCDSVAHRNSCLAGFEDDIGTAIEIAAPLGGIAFFLLAIKEFMVIFCLRHALRTTR